MKKVLSTLVAAIVALSFSAVVFAAEVKTDALAKSEGGRKLHYPV